MRDMDVRTPCINYGHNIHYTTTPSKKKPLPQKKKSPKKKKILMQYF